MQDLKEEAKEWLDENGKDASDDMLVVSIMWTVFTYGVNWSGVFLIEAVTFWKVTSFMVIIAYLFLISAVVFEPEEKQEDLLSYGT